VFHLHHVHIQCTRVSQANAFKYQQDTTDLAVHQLNLPFSQIFPTIDSLLASGLTPRLYDWPVSSEHLGFLWSPYVIGQTIIFLPCDFFLSIYLSSSSYGRPMK